MKTDFDFYKNRKVLITGHTGFKGTWMCKVLSLVGADITGYSLEPATNPNLFELCGIGKNVNSIIGDIRDLHHLKTVFEDVQPEIVIHMAAQPLVRESYQNPVYTYETNVMGTVNILESIRLSSSVKSFVNVTTDKVYLNREWEWGYRENEELNGYDPYSNSKSCSELITSSYIKSFFREKDIAISTCRAGNVIGGGDFANNRIIPDCVRAAEKGEKIIVRNPFSTRPYQHVLEPVTAYLMIAQQQYHKKNLAGNYNIGPNEEDCISTGELVTLFCDMWKKQTGECVEWSDNNAKGPHEANFLKLDCSKAKLTFGWKPKWNVETAIKKVVEWTALYLAHGNMGECMENQIGEFLR